MIVPYIPYIAAYQLKNALIKYSMATLFRKSNQVLYAIKVMHMMFENRATDHLISPETLSI